MWNGWVIQMGLKFFDLFAGVGGFRLGMEKAGHECVGACEIDKYARETYKKNFGHYPEYDDAKNMHPQSLPQFDVLCAGFPCQAFSVAGKRLGFNETRGTIFFEIARIAKEKRPRYLFLENVRGLLFHDKGRTFKTILSTLDELGYDAEWQVLNSKYFVPQSRERTFIIGHSREHDTRQVFPLGEICGVPEKVCSTEYLPSLTATDYKGPSKQRITNSIVQIGNIDTKGHNSIWGRVYDPNGVTPTLNANGGGMGAKTGLYATAHTKMNMKQRYQERDNTWTLDTSGNKMAVEHDFRIRKLTPVECERLQGFPDNWTQGVSDTQRYKQMGNAVTVDVVEYIARWLE
jgi:DNA (cytosine-5)-methyltransferase 1